MNLSEYDGKYICIKDIYGDTFTGRAEYGNRDFLECEFGGDEDGVFIEDFLIYHSQIKSIEEVEVHGTVELWTENLILRRYRPEDASQLHQYFGSDSEHSYSWIMDVDDVIVGTIGAYDCDQNQIELGFSVKRDWQGRGFATEAVKKVIEYLTENEGIPCVMAWCASENVGSRKVLEKAGMQLVSTEKAGLIVEDHVYDKLIYEYRKEKEVIRQIREKREKLKSS